MKPNKSPSTRLPVTGPLAEMPWVKLSRRPASASKSGAADVVYGIRSSEDIVQARSRSPADLLA